ncbi:MAG: hypothetical protein AAFQ61_07675, partial [Cyanobacteria bacterium J06626_23]
MTQPYDLIVGSHGSAAGLVPLLAQVDSFSDLKTSFSADIVGFIPTLLGALAILAIGIIIAFVASWIVGNILKRTTLDDKLASWVSGRPSDEIPTTKWGSAAVFWLVILFTLVAVLNALDLTVVSEPLNDLLSTIMEYLPRIAAAGLLLGVAWVIATLVKTLVTRALAQVSVDERLSQQTGVDATGSGFSLSDTLSTVLYWFIFLLFLPLVL